MKNDKNLYYNNLTLRLILMFLLAVGTSGMSAQTKPKNSEISFALHAAEDFLYEKGAEGYRLQLQLEEYTDRLFFFNDMKNHVFLLMARDDYSGLLNDQVLGFSIGVPHSKLRDEETFLHLYHYYDNLIKDMAEGKVPKEQKIDREKIFIPPMLFTIRWRQFPMTNVFEGQTEPVVYGCGAVAVAQLMKYYQWPKVVTGDFAYYDTKDNLRTIKMDGTTIEWERTKDVYLFKDPLAKTLDPLMKRVAMAMKVDFGNKTTTNWSTYTKRAMVQNFGYSPCMFLAERRNVDEAQMIKLIRDELKAGRPSILAGGRHQFVCDGAYNDFLHLNMGWGGSFDGWYRFPVVRKEINDSAFIESAMLNIRPLEQPGVSKTVKLEKPGTLDSLLTEEECQRISALRLEGRINGADIRLLRRMAGANEVKDYSSWKGMLTELDLADATIVRDTATCMEVDLKRTNFWVKVKGVRYDFAEMTKENWEDFCKNGGNDNPECIIVPRDTTYIMQIKTMENAVVRNMFESCENLQKIVLPKNLERIGMNAFGKCRCLKELTIPSGVTSSILGLISGCTSLETIWVCKDSPMLKYKDDVEQRANKNVFRYLHPNLKLKVDDTLETYAECYDRRLKEKRAKSGTTFYGETVKANTGGNRKGVSVPMGAKVVSHYKMVNGKRVLIGREFKK